MKINSGAEKDTTQIASILSDIDMVLILGSDDDITAVVHNFQCTMEQLQYVVQLKTSYWKSAPWCLCGLAHPVKSIAKAHAHKSSWSWRQGCNTPSLDASLHGGPVVGGLAWLEFQPELLAGLSQTSAGLGPVLLHPRVRARWRAFALHLSTGSRSSSGPAGRTSPWS